LDFGGDFFIRSITFLKSKIRNFIFHFRMGY
jgi:hypothetical protein